MDYDKLLSYISSEIKDHLNSGVGLNEFCRACDLSAAVMIKLRDGKSTAPKIETLSKLAKGFKLPESHFIDLLQFFNGQTTTDPRNPDDDDKPLIYDPPDDYNTPEHEALFRGFEKLTPEGQAEMLKYVEYLKVRYENEPSQIDELDDDI